MLGWPFGRFSLFFCAASVFVESKWNNRKREISSSLCDPVQNNTNKVHCYCSPLAHHPEQIGSAECYLTTKDVTFDDQSWERFRLLQNISRLTLTNTRGIAMNYIPTNAIKHTKAIIKLDVKYCNIEKIEPYAFANLSLVEELSLRDNQIKIMATNAFTHHARMKTLSLDQNNIAEINRNVFVDLPSLEQLFLTANKITTIHDKAFVHLGTLKELEIDNNSIFSLNNETFSGLWNLEKLELSGNSLEVIGDNTFAPLGNLRFLNLAENKIQMLDERAFNGLGRLQSLSLNHNKLSSLVNTKIFEGLPSLTSLSLKDNVISVIEPEVVIPILSNFYRKTSQLNIEGNSFNCSCKLDVFRSLINKTQNARLNIDIQNLQCQPSNEVKQKWDILQETIKSTAQVFDDVEPQVENAAYEYYDETELNGTLFYFDMRSVLNCSGDDNLNTPALPTSTQRSTIIIADKESTNNNLKTKEITSPTLSDSTSKHKIYPKKNIAIETTNRGFLDLSLAGSPIAKPKSKLKERDELDNDIFSKNKINHDNETTKQKSMSNKENIYTTSRLATVSAKPVERKPFDDHDMASDEAKPDRFNAHRSFGDSNDSPEYKHNSASRNYKSLLLIYLTVTSFIILLSL